MAASLGSVLSFGDAKAVSEEHRDGAPSVDDDGSGDDDFEFAFAPPLLGERGEAAHGRILPAYPVFDRRLLAQHEKPAAAAVPEPDTYCAWTPRSAPGSPERDAAVPLPKSASTGQPRRLRLRDVLLGSSGRSHSDGKEKFLFLQPAAAAAEDKRGGGKKATPSPSPSQQKNGKKKGGAAVTTEMDMATAHRLFYSKHPSTATTSAAAGERRPQSTSYLTYRPAFVGFFATAVGRSSHHPY